MISWDSGSSCEKARGYYYDWMDGEGEIPQPIRMHISHCDHCQGEIRRLARVLSSPSTADPNDAAHVSMINALLETHFKYAEMPVTCAVAKRFLPSMAALETRITIPTPITVHIEQCSGCRDDWLELQSLRISDVQLQRLAQCIEEDAHTASSLHEHLTNEQVQTFACVDYANLGTACLEHVCQCVSCRERALTARCDVVSHLAVEPHASQEVSWEDLFDLALPVGFNPLADEYSQFRQATVDHVSRCKTCLNRLGTLDRMLIKFLPPHECGVVTNYQLALDEAQGQADTEYEDYPIRVEVQDPASENSAEVEVSQRANPVLDHVPSHRSWGWIKAAAVVAVLLGLTVFSMLPRVGADFMDKVYEETTSAPVVHIRESVDGSTVISRETWIFRPHKVVVIDNKQVVTAYDASAGWWKTRHGAGLETRPLSGDRKTLLQGRIRELFDLWPLEMSETATLKPPSLEQAGFDVYAARQPINNDTMWWHASVDPSTQRVVRVVRSVGETEDSLTQTRSFDVDYPSLETAKADLRLRQIDFFDF